MQTTTSHIHTEKLPGGIALRLIRVKGDSFQMGRDESADERPIHKVTVPDFYLGQYPVTNAEYMAFAKATDSHFPEWLEEGGQYHILTGSDSYYKRLGDALTNDRHPVVGVSWHDAVAYCNWLSEQTGRPYRLPSEAEWEYAARGGNQSLGFRYAGGHKLKEVGWYSKNSHRETKPVGLKLPNELGLYDMSGNVWEWCADVWHDNYEGAPEDGSAWISGGDQARRVVRGGSWYYYAAYCSVSNRLRLNADYWDFLIGLRVARY